MEILSATKSICPVCFALLDAHYISENDCVYMVKNCKEHGDFKTIVWEGTEHFLNWRKPLANSKPPKTHKTEKGCPFDCGLCENHKQNTCCVLLEVTKRCNLGCPVCFASSEKNSKNTDPSIEKISGWYDMLMDSGGPFNIQLSGGEPTLRDDLDKIIKLGKNKGFNFFQLNTNGIRLNDEKYLSKLADAGLSTVFLQFDGLDDEINIKMRGEKLLHIKIKTIENCRKLNIGVVLVPTIKKGVNDKEIGNIIDFAISKMPIVRGVHFQPMSFFGRYQSGERMTISSMLKEISKQTNNAMKINDFTSGNAEHPHCSFHCDYIVKENILQPTTKKVNCCSSSQARDVVSRKWTAPEKITCCSNTDSFDKFLIERKTKSISISGMAFQDAWNFDLERVQRCYIHEVSQNGKLIPFCSYNVTNTNGVSLYRNKN